MTADELIRELEISLEAMIDYASEYARDNQTMRKVFEADRSRSQEKLAMVSKYFDDAQPETEL